MPFHKEYERRLPFSIYAPYAVLMVSTLLLFVVRPADVGQGWITVLFVLNASIMATSLAWAAPVHTQLDREGKHAAKIDRLVRFNALRLAAATASSGIMLYLLARVVVA